VNQTFVKKVFGQRESDRETGENRASLRSFEDAVKEPMFEIIGLVADVKNRGTARSDRAGDLGAVHGDGPRPFPRNPGADGERTADDV